MALGDVIARLSVHLGLETAAFEKGTKKAETRMSGFEKNMSRASKAVGTAFVGMLGVFAVDQIAAIAKQSLEFASSLGEVATQLGTTTRSLQEYRFAATQTGIEQDEMDKGLAKLARTIGEAAGGNEKAEKMFQRLGISIRDSSGNVRDAGDILPEVANAYTKLGSAAEQSALSAEVFGSKLGQKLNPLLAEGATGIQKFRDEAERMGLVLSDEVIANADAAADQLSTLEQFIKMKFTATVAENSKEIGELASQFMGLISSISSVRSEWRQLQLMMDKFDVWTAGIGTTSLQERISDSASIDRQIGMETGETWQQARWRSRNRAERRQRSKAIQTLSPALWGAGSIVGGPLGGAMKSPDASSIAPWMQRLQGSAKAVGANPFGGGFGQFDPGQGSAGWMRMAQAASDMAERTGWVDTLMTRISMQTGVRMVANFREAAVDAEHISQAAQGIIDRLFPDDARLRKYIDDLAILRLEYGNTAANSAKLAEAEKRLRNEWLLSTPAVEGLSKGFGRYMSAVHDAAQTSEVTAVRVAKSFGDMAQDVSNSLAQLTSSIKGGGFLDILSSVFGFGLQLGKVGAFGKNIQTNLNRVPAYANGTSFARGGLSLVGERGPELVNLPRGASVTPNNKLGGATRVEIVDTTGLFVTRVNGIVQPAALAAARGGAAGAVAQMARSQRRRTA